MRVLIGAILIGIFITTTSLLLLSESINPILIITALISGIGVIFILILSLRHPPSKKREEEFMMETFRELVSQMKERHIELDIFNENILQSVPSGVMSINREGIITKINEAGIYILGRSDITGRHISEVMEGPLLEYIMNREYLKREEVLCEFSGRKVWLGFSISPLKDRNKNVIGKIVTFTDITEFKELQERMKLRETLQGLGEMAAGIAHELRNPMAVLRGYADILRKKADPTLWPIIESMTKEINLMDSIIRDFLTFARYDEPNLVSISIEGLVEDTLSSVIDKKDLSHIMITREIEPFLIKADETLLKQAIKNLLQNAIEAMPDGGVLTIKGKRDEGFYILSVSDTGKGIPEDLREKVFIPFFTTKEGGTGLGLSIVHKAITAHGGDVYFETSEKGTTFTLRIPLRA